MYNFKNNIINSVTTDEPPIDNTLTSPTGRSQIIDLFRSAISSDNDSALKHEEVCPSNDDGNTPMDYIVCGGCLLCGVALLGASVTLGVGLTIAALYLTYKVFLRNDSDVIHNHIEDLVCAGAIAVAPTVIASGSIAGMVIDATLIATSGGLLNLYGARQLLNKYWWLLMLIMLGITYTIMKRDGRLGHLIDNFSHPSSRRYRQRHDYNQLKHTSKARARALRTYSISIA